MNRKSELSLIAVVVLIFVGIWFYRTYGVMEYTDKRRPPGNEIRINPMSALAELLRNRDVRVKQARVRSALNALPSTEAAILIRRLRQPLSLERQSALLEWLSKGGLLIFEPHAITDADSALQLIEQLGIHMDTVDGWSDFSVPNHGQAIVNNDIISLHISPEYTLSAETEAADAIILSEAGVHGLMQTVGQGAIVVLTDARFLDNPIHWWIDDFVTSDSIVNIKQHEHAYFILDLLDGHEEVWLVAEIDSQSLASILLERLPSFLFLSCIFLILLFWWSLKRFGPVVTEEIPSQRDLLMHIEQVGRYHWAQDNAQVLLQHWRQKVIKRLQFKHPALSALDTKQFTQGLANISQLDAQQIYHALYQDVKHEQDFLLSVRRLQELWKV